MPELHVKLKKVCGNCDKPFPANTMARLNLEYPGSVGVDMLCPYCGYFIWCHTIEPVQVEMPPMQTPTTLTYIGTGEAYTTAFPREALTSFEGLGGRRVVAKDTVYEISHVSDCGDYAFMWCRNEWKKLTCTLVDCYLILEDKEEA